MRREEVDVGRRADRPVDDGAAPRDQLDQEQELIDSGVQPATILDINLWARDFEEIDLFNWQQAVAGMIPISEVERELATGAPIVYGIDAAGKRVSTEEL